MRVNASASSSRSSRRPLGILLGVVIAIVVILLAAELITRFIVGRQLADSYQDRLAVQGVTTDESPSVSFGTSPLLLSLFTQRVGYAEIETPDTLQYGGDSGTTISGQPPSTITLNDLDISDRDNPVAGHLAARAELSDDFLLATAQSALSGQDATGLLQSFVSVTGVTSSCGTVTVTFNEGLASVVLDPIATNDGLFFEVTETNVAGINLPDQVSTLLSDAVTKGVNAQLSKLGTLHVTETSVEEGSVFATVEGDNVNLNELGQAAQRFY